MNPYGNITPDAPYEGGTGEEGSYWPYVIGAAVGFFLGWWFGRTDV